jgi:CRISPR-associated protein Csm2
VLLKPPATPLPYFGDNTGIPRKALLESEAQETAQKLATLPASQLRRFYAEVMALKRRLDLDAALPDDEIAAQLALLKARAAYTRARRKDYPNELVAFFTRHAAAVRTRDDFMRGFQPHFEAVMAYHRVFEQKRGDRD